MADEIRVEGILSKGYGSIPKLVMRDKNLDIKSKAVYAYFASYTGNGSDNCFPAKSLICNDLGISKEVATRCIRNLVEHGYIIVTQSRNEKGVFSHNIYTLCTEILPYTDNPYTDNPYTDNTATNNNNSLNKNNSNKNTNNRESKKKDAEELFEELWTMYPKKKGKGQVSDSKKLKLLDIGRDQMVRCVVRYKAEIDARGTEEQFIKNGSTFFNSGYIDYLDENYTPSSTEKKNNNTNNRPSHAGMREQEFYAKRGEQ